MSKKILLVDDDPNIVISLEFLMKRNGYQVTAARNGVEAITQVEAVAPDLILLDIMMPLRDGFEVCRMIRENPAWRDIKIVLLTARGRPAEITKGLSLGADAYITKPFSTQDLLAQVHEITAKTHPRRHDPNLRPLSELAYTVFDTETTGLTPSKGDEIISIGALHIVNSKLAPDASFNQLVDPRRKLKPASAKIHGITPAMLQGQPTIDQVLPAFRRFCENTVLVAHNAAFDMRFLQLKETQTGIRFDQPVLDTLLLSTVIHPRQKSHTLETIAERMKVRVIGRHTALGDTLITAGIFLKMIPLLNSLGIHTLKDAVESSKNSRYAHLQY